MPTCANNTFLDYALMFIQFLGLGLAVLIATGFLQRGLQKLIDGAWHLFCRAFNWKGSAE